MPLTPGYGETPLPHDELTALLPHVVKVLEKPVSRAAVYDLEQAVQEQVSEDLLTAAFNGSLSLDELLTDYSETSTLGLTQDRSPSNSAAHSTTSDIGG